MDKVLQFLELFLQTDKQLVEQNRLDILKRLCREESYYNPQMPRILVLGRFKAGKSMLINALIGKKLAAVDALEKTAWIARYWPAKKPFCYLQNRDDSIVEISVEEFVEKTESNQYSLHFLQGISRIDVGYEGEQNHFALIDSPGFGSVNTENEKLAMEALKDADLVIYAVDVKKIGNLRENSLIQEIRKSGVPMICVGTKYDGAITKHKNCEEIKVMIAEYTDFEEKDIFPVSAKEYFSQETDTDGGVKALFEFCNQVAVHNYIFRQNGASSRRFRVNNSLIQELQELQNELFKIQRAGNRFENEYDYARSRIRSELVDFIKDYVPKTLYAEYKENLIHMIQLINEKDMGENGMQIIQNMIPEGYMDRYWENLSVIVTNKMHELWKERLNLDREQTEEWRYLLQDMTMIRNMDMSYMGKFLQLGYDKELSERGVKLSFEVAALSSVYEAVLGVNAAQVVLSGALLSTGLPIMLIGCGLTAYWLKKRRGEAQQKTEDIRRVLNHNINHFADSVIDKCMSKMAAVDAHVKSVYMDYYEKEFRKYCPRNHTLEELMDKCNGYISELYEQTNNLVYYDENGNLAIDKLHKTENQLHTAMYELDRITVENADLKTKLERAEVETHEMQEERERAEEECRIATAQYRESERKLQETEEKADNYRKQVADSKKKEEQARKECKETQREYENAQKVQIRLEKELNDTKTISEAEKSGLRKELSHAKGMAEKYNQERLEAEKKVKRAQKERETAEMQERKAVKQLEVERNKRIIAQDKLDKANDKLGEKAMALETQFIENKKLKENLTESRKKEKEQERKIADLQKRLDEASAKRDSEYEERKIQIYKDLDAIIHNGKNKFVLNEEIHKEMEEFENLLFLCDTSYDNFLMDFSELLQLGNGFMDKHKKNIECLVDDRYIYTRLNEYRLYYGVQRDTNEVYISYIEAFIRNDEKSKRYRDCLRKVYILEDDQIRYKILDAIRSAKREILIAVPWILSNAWEKANRYPLSMQEALINALNREKNLRLIIVTGISGEDAEKSINELKTDNMVATMREQFKPYGDRVQIYNNCVIHIKYLVVDNTCALQGSLNYLSNQSIYAGDARAAESMQVTEKTGNVEDARLAVYRRANKVYTRLRE